MARLMLDDRVESVSGVGPRTAKQLGEAFGIVTVRDLVEHYPRRHADLGEVVDLDEVRVGQPATLVGEVLAWHTRRTRTKRGRRSLTITEGNVVATSGDDWSGRFLVTFFNQQWRERSLPPGTVAAFSGKIERFRGDLKIGQPGVQVLGARGSADLDHQRLVPVYPATESLPSFKLASLVAAALDDLAEVTDWLPLRWCDEQDLITLDAALRGIHEPPDRPTADAARRRLVFDELFTLQLGLQWRRAKLEAALAGIANWPHDDGLAARFLSTLPFEPTGAQDHAITEIGLDLGGDRPMHRLLQGDVGSGKTLVAVWAMLTAVDNRRQAALMAPTEVLAEQHHRTLLELLAPLGVNVLDGVRIELMTSSTTVTQRRRILGQLLSGDVDLVVGTHALLEEGVRFADLGVVVIDEQHRFGVSQRVQLKEKAAEGTDGRKTLPDVLVMTATPIPRSLALTLYGDLDVTVLGALPPGREPITTQLITPAQSGRRERLYDFVREQAAAGSQTFVVCPLVEESEAVGATAAVSEHKRLAEHVLADLTVELVHGRMSADDKDAAMSRFRRGEAQVLVATTVVEVGVDVPQATIMIIEDAERFGISQLHQMRGRVGRGGERSYCVLFAGWHDELSDDAKQRLRAVASSTDGFVLAETDLEVRGQGQLFGRKQSGMPDLKLARLGSDRATITHTRDLAKQVIGDDPDLTAAGHRTLRAEVLRRYDGGLEAFAALQTG